MNGQVCIIGIGGAGCRIIDHVVDVVGCDTPVVAINTDSSALSMSRATTKLQIGESITSGFGAGGDADVGRRALEDDIGMIRSIVENAKIVFVVVGLGGGTGTGAAPVLLKVAREAGALTLCFVTLPFQFEGQQRTSAASEALKNLRNLSDILITTPNERLCRFVAEPRAADAFEKADNVLGSGVSAIATMITKPGFINLDFADLQNMLQQSGGLCTFGYGEGNGSDKAEQAVTRLLDSPLISSDQLMASAESLIVSIVGGPDLTLVELGIIMDKISSKIKKDCNLAMGTVKDEIFEGRIAVTVLASTEWTYSDSTESDAMQRPVYRKNNKKSGKVLNALEVQLPLFQHESVGKRRFKNVEPTIMDGENLDIPTFMRRGISL